MVSAPKLARKGKARESETQSHEGGSRPRASRVRLQTMADTRREAGKLYREARGGVLNPVTACKLGFLLQLVGRLVEVEQLEQRIEHLERRLSNDGGSRRQDPPLGTARAGR